MRDAPIGLHQAISFRPFMRHFVMLFQIACTTGDDNIANVIRSTTTQRDDVIGMIGVFALFDFAFTVITFALLPFTLCLNILSGAVTRDSILTCLAIEIKGIDQDDMRFLVLSYVFLSLLHMFLGISLIIFRMCSVVALSMLLTTFLATMAQTVFASFIEMKIFRGRWMPLLTFRTVRATLLWYNATHDRDSLSLSSRLGMLAHRSGITLFTPSLYHMEGGLYSV
jgi:hypothetical protein